MSFGKTLQSPSLAEVNAKNYINPLPDMQILGSSNSVANKDTMSELWTNGDTII